MGDDPRSLTGGTKSLGPQKDRPTLLMVGHGEPMDAALRLAFDRHGLFLEESSTADSTGAVRMAAPDLVLLVGDAAKDGGRAVLEALSKDPSTSVVPVALLAEDEGALDKRVLAFRYGAIAAVSRSASADEIARRVAQLARETPDGSEAGSAELGEATLDELVALVTRELRSGILSVERQGGAATRIVLGAGRPVADAVQEFVQKMQPLVSRAEPLAYEFHKDGAGGTIGLLDGEGARSSDLSIFHGLRVLLVDHDLSRVDALTQVLRGRGAIVAVSDTAGRGLERASGLDPEIVIMDAAGIDGPGFDVVRQLRRDLRLRWASILVAPWDELWPNPRGAPDAERLAEKIAPLVMHDRALRDRARDEDAFDVRLEATGPCRLLRVLAGLTGPYHVSVRSSKAVVEIDLAEGLVVGASGTRASGGLMEGTSALAALLAMGSARAHVERRANPSTANVMAPVEEALARASQETPPIAPSMPPPPRAASDAPAPSASIGGLLGRRRPFPNASELGRDNAMLVGRSTDADDSVAGAIVAPPSATRLSPSGTPSVAGDLRWDASSARPGASPRAAARSPAFGPERTTLPGGTVGVGASSEKLPQGVLSGAPTVVPRPHVPRPGALPRPPASTSGVLRSSASSQRMPAVRPRPAIEPEPAERATPSAPLPKQSGEHPAIAAPPPPSSESLEYGERPPDSASTALGRIAPKKTVAALRGVLEEEVTASGGDPRVESAIAASRPTPVADARALAADAEELEELELSLQSERAGPPDVPRPPEPPLPRQAPVPPQAPPSEAALFAQDTVPAEAALFAEAAPPASEAALFAEAEVPAQAPSEVALFADAVVPPEAPFAQPPLLAEPPVRDDARRPAAPAEAEVASSSAAQGLGASAPAASWTPAGSMMPDPVPQEPARPVVVATRRESKPGLTAAARSPGRAVGRGVAFFALAVAALTLVAVSGVIAARKMGIREIEIPGIGALGLGGDALEDAPVVPDTDDVARSDEGAATDELAHDEIADPIAADEIAVANEVEAGDESANEVEAGDESANEAEAGDESPNELPAEHEITAGAEDDVATAEDQAIAADPGGDTEPPAGDPTGASEDEGSAVESADDLLARARSSPPPMAETLYRRALELEPQNHYAMLGLAELLLERGDAAAALPFAEDAVRRRSRRAPYRVLLGDVRRAAGDEAGAREAWESALELDPDNRQALRRLGREPAAE